MTEEEKIICKQFLNDADKTHSCSEYKLLMDLIEQEPCEDCITCEYSDETDGNHCYECVKGMRNFYTPTTKNNLGADAVSRKAVLNTLDSMDSALDEDRTVETYKDLLKECYKDLPSVTPQERKGHWIKIKPYPLQMHEYECSECGHETNDNTECYCSECGAKMEIEDGWTEVKGRRMTNLEAIRLMNLQEVAYFLSVIKWDDLNSIHMIPKEDIDYFTEYLNKDGSELIESVKSCMEDWKKYMESEE